MRLLLAIGVLALAASVLLAVPAGAQGSAIVSVQAPDSVEVSDEPVQVDVAIADSPELGGFQLILTYDPELFSYDSAERGEFLGSTGRELICNDPVADTGAVLLVCGTLGAEPAGPEGAGILYSVFLTPKGTGDAVIDIATSGGELASPEGNPIQFTTRSLTVRVDDASSGMNWVLWGPIIAITALLIIGVIVSLVIVTRRTRTSPPAAAPTIE